MYNLLLVAQWILCILLILLVLMQNGKGSSAGIFGNSTSDSVFSSPTAATFITKLTAVIAVLIMIVSITLTVLVSKRGMDSVVDMQVPVSAPAQPANQTK